MWETQTRALTETLGPLTRATEVWTALLDAHLLGHSRKPDLGPLTRAAFLFVPLLSFDLDQRPGFRGTDGACVTLPPGASSWKRPDRRPHLLTISSGLVDLATRRMLVSLRSAVDGDFGTVASLARCKRLQLATTQELFFSDGLHPGRSSCGMLLPFSCCC